MYQLDGTAGPSPGLRALHPLLLAMVGTASVPGMHCWDVHGQTGSCLPLDTKGVVNGKLSNTEIFEGSQAVCTED